MDRKRSARAIHDNLGYPVIDADGHWVEFGPWILECLKEVAGERVAQASKRPNDYIGRTIWMTRPSGAEPASRRKSSGSFLLATRWKK